MEAILEELKVLVKARYPFIYLISWEEERVIRGLVRQVANPDRIQIWSATQGFPDTANTQDPLACLEHIHRAEPRQVFCLLDFHTALEDPMVVRRLRELENSLAEAQKPILFVSPILRLPRELEKDFTVLDIPLPTAPEISRLLGGLLQARNIAAQPAVYERTVKATLGLTEKEIIKVYTRIMVSGGKFSEEDLQTLIQEKKRIIRKSQFLEFLDSEEDLEAVGGLANLKQWLVSRGRAFSERARQYGLPTPKGLFMVGVQGCGKSLTAKAVARHWRMPLLRLDVASLVSAREDGDNNLRETIRVAESMAPVVLWIDEIEKAFIGASGSGAEGNVARIFGGLLTWLQEKNQAVFVIATANDIQNLPPELLRKGRFDEIFFVDLPNVHDRRAILEIHVKKRSRDPAKFELYSVAEATEKFSGAELEQLIVSALFDSFSKERELTTRDLILAARDTVPLAVTMEEQIKALKDWAGPRTRPAAHNTRRVDFFEVWEQA